MRQDADFFGQKHNKEIFHKERDLALILRSLHEARFYSFLKDVSKSPNMSLDEYIELAKFHKERQ